MLHTLFHGMDFLVGVKNGFDSSNEQTLSSTSQSKPTII
jgi:hypothetical protein